VGADFESRLSAGLIGDGPLLAGLRAQGLDEGLPAEAANLEHPEWVAAATQEYVAAGSEMICTNSRAGSPFALERWGLFDRAEEVNRTAAAVARGAADSATGPPGGVIVAGQIGPSGKLMGVGEVGEDELAAAFAEQAGWLVRGGADVILLARFLDLTELLVAVRACGELSRPIIAALVFDSGPERLETAAGQPAAECAVRLLEAGVEVIGCDCASPETALSLVGILAEHGKQPVFVRTNAGTPELEGGRVIFGETPEAFGERVAGLRGAGAAIVAGCCGATAGHVGAARRALDSAGKAGGGSGRRK